MRRRMRPLLLPACVLAAGAQAETGLPLSDAVLHGLRPIAGLRAELDPATDKACLDRYLGSIPRRSPLWHTPAPDSAEAALPALRRNLIEQMVALLGESARTEAVAFVHELPLAIEWEGMMENPLAEAAFVADWLAGHPASPLAPFLHLLHAHRLDAAWRYAPASRKAELSRRFDSALAPALTSTRPVIACLAHDLRARHATAR